MKALDIIRQVTEGEDPKHFFKNVMPSIAPPYVVFLRQHGLRNNRYQPYSLTWYYTGDKIYDNGPWATSEQLAAQYRNLGQARSAILKALENGQWLYGFRDPHSYQIAEVKPWQSSGTGLLFNYVNTYPVTESEDPKQTFKQLPRKPTNQFEVGEEIIHGTGDTRDIMEACLNALKRLDKFRFMAEISDHDVFQYTTLGDIENDFDPEYYLYEHLFDVMQKYCPMFTYFGGRYADGAIGCWPPESEHIDDLVGTGKLTFLQDHQAFGVMHGDFTGIETRYVLVEYDGDMELWDSLTKQPVWKY